MKNLPTPGKVFISKKQKILSQLSLPDEQYTDASPKGSVDEGIRYLIDQINMQAGLVTTSSCAGRVSVYLEGPKFGQGASSSDGEETAGNGDVAVEAGRENAVASSVGGKGGGEWLFVSHDPVKNDAGESGYERLFGFGTVPAREQFVQDVFAPSTRLIHFKFEPMILHILTASLEHAQLVIQAGMEAGFRESGAVSLLKKSGDDDANPMVAIRSMGLSFDSLIGAENDGIRRLIVSSEYLKMLVRIANERFVENQKRIARFSAALESAFAPPKAKANWESAQARREQGVNFL
ncbi:uncharacterized protein CTHT_0012240 [Thermochaetoides thermophila DSM 1495]|uniref:tRNA(Phe) 7-[(3-amino-3-carboxypropyl)-4-demethylwyosine(37)-N(4)]-methyltransferase n=1 Tax=Chaetomium thermophilum (strain DSM 1495 / CBS 144.50 / IMI 039719) TaxID=759272 RepID=G0S139_CHATD|nr:hypothetical protein CTHT_0012240 [Thermochaetoides thermophila DSM 1495]EGS22749.1 hypothetical protein CTHT_0012240 [Thermochaetoides thermophila DSM 1495]